MKLARYLALWFTPPRAVGESAMETIEIGGEPLCMAAGGLSLARVCHFWSQRHERPQPLFPLWLLSLTRGMHEQRMKVCVYARVALP